MITSITNLAFEGGGVRGIAYGGALEALEKAGVLSKVQRVAGTSAGAITACLVALKYSAQAISEIVANMNLASFEDKDHDLRKFKDFGLYEGQVFLEWLSELVAASPVSQGSENLTFQGLVNNLGLELKVYATDLFTHALKEFSPTATPNVRIAEAVRASMSIPLYFDAWKFSNNNPDDHFYVDGGVLYNYPIAAFDHVQSGQVNADTLGFQFENLSAAPIYTPFHKGELGKYLKSLVDTLMYTQSVAFSNSAVDALRTITIDNLGVSSTDFEIDNVTKNKLIESGWNATIAYLQKQGVDTSGWAAPTLLAENRAIGETLC